MKSLSEDSLTQRKELGIYFLPSTNVSIESFKIKHQISTIHSQERIERGKPEEQIRPPPTEVLKLVLNKNERKI